MKTIENFKNIGEYAYCTVKEQILTMQFPPFERLSEIKVAEVLKISKTPVREAFIKLSEEGLVDIRPQKGSVVTPISLTRVEESRFVRKSIEIEVLKTIVQYCRETAIATCEKVLKDHEKVPNKNYIEHFEFDDTFHRKLYDVAGMSRTYDMMSKMSGDNSRVRYLVLIVFEKSDKILSDHYNIYKALCNNDLELLLDVSEKHMNRWNEEKDLVVKSYRTYFE